MQISDINGWGLGSVVLAKAVYGYTGQWPNDLLLNGKKANIRPLWDLLSKNFKNSNKRVGWLYDPSQMMSTSFLETENARGYPAPGLWGLAEAGLAEGVEFRRLARKYLRRVKNDHCRVLVAMEPIWGEEKTKKGLQHILGTQIRLVTPEEAFGRMALDFPLGDVFSVATASDLKFVKTRTEKILRQKLSRDGFQLIE